MGIYYSFRSHELFSSFDPIYQRNSLYSLVKTKKFVFLKLFITFFVHATVSTLTFNGMSDYAVARQIRCGVNINFCVTLQGLKKINYSLRQFFYL